MYIVAVTAALASLFGLTILRQIEGMRWDLCPRQVEITAQNASLSRTVVFEELRKMGITVTDIEYDHNIGENESRLTFNVRLQTEQGLEPMLTRLESLPGMRGVKVRRIG